MASTVTVDASPVTVDASPVTVDASPVRVDASTAAVDQYGNEVDQWGNKTNKWVRQRDGGARRHKAGDNQSHVGYSFPSWQRDSPGTDLLLGEEWDGNGQYWRTWELANVWSHEFFEKVIEALGGKAHSAFYNTLQN